MWLIIAFIFLLGLSIKELEYSKEAQKFLFGVLTIPIFLGGWYIFWKLSVDIPEALSGWIFDYTHNVILLFLSGIIFMVIGLFIVGYLLGACVILLTFFLYPANKEQVEICANDYDAFCEMYKGQLNDTHGEFSEKRKRETYKDFLIAHGKLPFKEFFNIEVPNKENK